MIENLKQIYANYLAEATEVKEKAPRWAGIFGLGSDPRKHACHEQFYENVGKWMEEFVRTQPENAAALEVAQFLLEMPKQNEKSQSYWFYYVCIGYIQKLIPFLAKADCKALADRLNVLYPKIERMPLQQDTYKMLLKAAK